jgi:hypothetical protein
MKRRSKAGGEASKARGREALKRERRDAPKTLSLSAPTHDAEVARLTRELNEAREQQTATADVLHVISSSPGELKPVFHSVLEKATRLCGASFGTLFLIEGESFRRVALHNAPAKYAEFADQNPLIPYHQSRSLNRLTETKRAVHVTDMIVEEPENAGYKVWERTVACGCTNAQG